MKKITVSLILFLLLVILSSSSVLSQANPTAAPAFDYSRAYSDYIFNMDLYNQAHNAYTLAVAQYTQSQTLESKENARVSTYKMLTKRDEAVKTYLTAVRMKLFENSGMSNTEKQGFLTRIDAEVGWWTSHETRIPSAGTLEDLSADSQDAKSHYNSITVPLVYQSLIAGVGGSLDSIRSQQSSEVSALNSKISEIRANNDKDTSGIERSLLDIQNKISRAQGKESEARSVINAIKATDTSKEGDYSDAQSLMQDAYSYLKDANQNLTEIIRQIKTN